MKKSWIVVDAKTHKKEDIQKETVYCLDDDDETEVQKEDVIQGMSSGKAVSLFIIHYFAQFKQNENIVETIVCLTFCQISLLGLAINPRFLKLS